MKVVHILHELKFSGAEIMYVDAASFFQEKGCELTVVATAKNLGDYAPYFEKAGYTVLHKEIPHIKNFVNRIKCYASFIKLFKENKFDVVHIHSHKVMWGMALCAWLAKTRSVYTFHNVFPTKFYTYLYHCLLRWSAKKIFTCKFQTISDSVYNHERNFYLNKTHKIYNWYGSNRFFPANADEKMHVRKELGIDTNTLVIVSVGGCSTVKRHSEIIKAIPLINKKIPKVCYLHLGEGLALEDELQLAEQLGVKDQIMFCGNQTNVRKYLIASDIYLMTSLFEGISITTIEAMACEIPAILYDVPGLRDFNNTEETSILIKPDYMVLAEKILFFKENPNLAMEIALRAKTYVNNNYSLKINANKIFELYK